MPAPKFARMTDPVSRLNEALDGRYRIERQLGEGGMATVYLAEDVRHGRKVALKVLKPELAAVVGAERFLAEIRTTAGLQHPHILPLHDSGEADGLLFYVMPYVEGESLRERLDREKQLPVDEAVGIVRKVAGALQAAHERGVVHRDVKPANVLLSQGEPLVADFGIALAVQHAGGGRLTETGLSLGTPYYMSPEQALADRDPDARSDVYSLACVLYETLTGEPPFTGGTAQAVLGRILTADPTRPTELRRAVPPGVEAALLRALEKTPADRYSSAADFARALGGEGDAVAPSPVGPASGLRRPSVAAGAAVAGLVGLGAGALVGAGLATGPGARDVGLPYAAPVAGGMTTPAFAVAGDGSFIVYEGGTGAATQLWYRSLVGDEARPIAGTEGASWTPRISPDGRRVAFVSESTLRIAPIAGGVVTTVAEVEGPVGGRWQDDGLIFFSDGDGRLLRWIDPESGPVRELAVEYCLLPVPMSEADVLCGGGGDKFGFVRRLDESVFSSRMLRQAGPEGTRRLRGSQFRVIDEDYVTYTSIDGTLMATRFLDRDSLLVGRSVALVPNVRRQTYTGAGEYDLTDDGTLVYVEGANAEVGRLVRNDLRGGRSELPGEPAAHLRFAPGPDGRRLASVVEGIQDQELRIYDLSTGSFQVLAQHPWIGYPMWGPDGDHVVYPRSPDDGSDAEYLVLHRFDAADRPRVVLELETSRGLQPASYLSPDSLVLGVGDAESSVLLIDPTRDPAWVEELGVNALFVGVSPDRRWFAWANTEEEIVYLEPWPARDRRWEVARDVIEPRWLSDNTLIFFSADEVLDMPISRLSLEPGSDPPVGTTRVVVEDPRRADTPGWSVAITPDDALVYLQMPERLEGSYVRVVPGWVREMKRAVDDANR